MSGQTMLAKTNHADFANLAKWGGRLFVDPAGLPFSFQYEGRKIAGILAGWNPTIQRRRIDANLLETVYAGKDPTSGLSVRCEVVEYQDQAVVEWVVWLENESDRPSGLIENLLGLDARFEGGAARLAHSNGDFYSAEGYTPQVSSLGAGEQARFAPTGGRPCDGAFPYFRLLFAEGGLTLAVGWPGQWSAEFSGDGQGVGVRAGQELTRLRLAPGERVHTPRMTLMAWSGEEERAINLWRRWYGAHILPRADGAPLRPHLACAATEGGEEFTNATEENQIRLMEKFKRAGFDFDVWWIDAGWYPCLDEESGNKIWWHTGTWRPDAPRFPNGFVPVARRANELGAELLVWFEPERVFAGSELDREHPEWLLKTRPKAEGSPDMNRLLNLGLAECREWLTEHVCGLIAQSGIGVYRQDFNFPPLNYWRDNDAEDRQGMNENLHVQGYLAYWDELLRRNPGLWIDSCSSGGRRNDLETMRRSVPLHYTDFGYGNHAVKLAFHRTLFEWIPYFKDFSLSWDLLEPGEDMRFDKQIDSFSFHCGMAAMFFATIDIRRDDYDFAVGRQMLAVWRKAADTLLHGDYYELTPFSKSAAEWVAWQFERPEEGHGLVQAIRLQECEPESLTVRPRVLRPEARYVFENAETGEKLELAGEDLVRAGFTFRLPRRSGAIWFYRIV